MTTRDYVYWLQGFFEISKAEELNKEQVLMIKNHLNLVFFHDIDPKDPEPVKSQTIHDISSVNGIIKHNTDNPGNKVRC